MMRFFHSTLIYGCTLALGFCNLTHADDTASPLFNIKASSITDRNPKLAELTYSPLANKSERTNLVKFAKTLIGTPYRYGGSSRSGFDCSGLVRFVFARLGHKLPRISHDQYQSLTPVDTPQIGDLVFFGHNSRVSHVGIHVGNGKMLHAPSSGKTVTIDTYTSGYWSKRYLGARSVIAPEPRQIAASTTYYFGRY